MGPTISFFHIFAGETFSLNLSCNTSQTTCPRLLMCLALSAVSSFKSPTSIPPTCQAECVTVCPSRSLDPSWSSLERLPRQPLSAESGAPEAAAVGPVPAGTAAVRLPSGDTCAPGLCSELQGLVPARRADFQAFQCFWTQPLRRRAGGSRAAGGRLELGPAQRPSPSAGNHGPLYLQRPFAPPSSPTATLRH